MFLSVLTIFLGELIYTQYFSYYLYVNDTTITTQPISPLIFRLNNSITSQVFSFLAILSIFGSVSPELGVAL